MVSTSGVSVWAEGIGAGLKEKLPKQRKTQRGKLALLVATMLHVRSANLVELAAGLPLETDRTDMRYQWIVRFLANTLVCCDTVMEPFARDVRLRPGVRGPRRVGCQDRATRPRRRTIVCPRGRRARGLEAGPPRPLNGAPDRDGECPGDARRGAALAHRGHRHDDARRSPHLPPLRCPRSVRA